MKTISLILAITLSLSVNAQIEKISLQASGLTCSMCSNAINKALKSLDFVKQVETDLATNTFDITFHINSSVDFDKIKRKVEGAGFSISRFEAAIDFDSFPFQKGAPVIIGNNKIVFVNLVEQDLKGIKKIRLLDKGFVSKKEFRRSRIENLEEGVFHASI
jgi:copper chaperone CopZ